MEALKEQQDLLESTVEFLNQKFDKITVEIINCDHNKRNVNLQRKDMERSFSMTEEEFMGVNLPDNTAGDGFKAGIKACAFSAALHDESYTEKELQWLFDQMWGTATIEDLLRITK